MNRTDFELKGMKSGANGRGKMTQRQKSEDFDSLGESRVSVGRTQRSSDISRLPEADREAEMNEEINIKQTFARVPPSGFRQPQPYALWSRNCLKNDLFVVLQVHYDHMRETEVL
jgi:hypothetical protein